MVYCFFPTVKYTVNAKKYINYIIVCRKFVYKLLKFSQKFLLDILCEFQISDGVIMVLSYDL